MIFDFVAIRCSIHRVSISRKIVLGQHLMLLYWIHYSPTNRLLINMVLFQNRLCTFIRQSQLSTVIIYFSHEIVFTWNVTESEYSCIFMSVPASVMLSQAKFVQTSSISNCLFELLMWLNISFVSGSVSHCKWFSCD